MMCPEPKLIREAFLTFPLIKEVEGYPAGTKVVLIESLGDGAAWIAEVAIEDDTLVGGFRWDTIEVKETEIE